MSDTITLPRQTAQQILAALRVAVTPVPKDRQAILRLDAALQTALERQQAEPPPEWPLIKNILAVFGLDAISFVAKWQAAQQQVKPVGQLQECLYGRGQVLWFEKPADLSMLYTAPPQQQAEPVQRKPLTDDLYYELLFAVGNRYPDETRHQTALRYIRRAEMSSSEPSSSAHGIKERNT